MSDNQSIGQAGTDVQNEPAESEISGASPSEPVQITSESDLVSVVDEYDVVLADFYADWCGPCKMIEPVVADIAAETDAVVAKIDVDVNQGLAAQYGVRGVPTLLLFADGEQAEQLVGAQPKERLTDLVEQHL